MDSGIEAIAHWETILMLSGAAVMAVSTIATTCLTSASLALIAVFTISQGARWIGADFGCDDFKHCGSIELDALFDGKGKRKAIDSLFPLAGFTINSRDPCKTVLQTVRRNFVRLASTHCNFAISGWIAKDVEVHYGFDFLLAGSPSVEIGGILSIKNGLGIRKVALGFRHSRNFIITGQRSSFIEGLFAITVRNISFVADFRRAEGANQILSRKRSNRAEKKESDHVGGHGRFHMWGERGKLQPISG